MWRWGDAGTRAGMIASLTDPGVAATQCALWYDRLRRNLLRTAPWAFARRQIVLTQLGDLIPDATSPYPWGFKYAYPEDCIKMRYVLPPPPPSVGGVAPLVGTQVSVPFLGPQRQCRYIIHNDVVGDTSARVLLTNVYQASGVFTGDVTNVGPTSTTPSSRPWCPRWPTKSAFPLLRQPYCDPE